MTLLFITQKLHGQDAFGALWADAFSQRGYQVKILCLEWQPEEMGKVLGKEIVGLDVVSLGKEKGYGKIRQILRFWKLITTLKYDRVFIHMTPVWGFFGAPVWLVRRTPVYLWYTHYKMQIGLWCLGHYAKRMFCATPQSLPQYKGSSKKIVVGHGIDMQYWPQRENHAADPKKLLMVHRLSRSKRIELSLHALTKLPGYSLDIYGIEAEKDYAEEMKTLTRELGLADRVTFKGTIPMKDLPSLYSSHRLILNMASETIDKTMLEAMTCGCYPVTTVGNAKAIGISEAPSEDTSEAMVAFISKYAERAPLSTEAMYEVVKNGHSLEALIAKMDVYIHPGN